MSGLDSGQTVASGHKDKASRKGYVPSILSWSLTIYSSVASWVRSGVFVFNIFLLWVRLMTWTHDHFCHLQLPKATSSTISLCSEKASAFACLENVTFSPYVLVVWKPQNHHCLFFLCTLFCFPYSPGATRHPGSCICSRRLSRSCTRYSSEK